MRYRPDVDPQGGLPSKGLAWTNALGAAQSCEQLKGVASREHLCGVNVVP
jgi:hypothetical protein